jgi:pimeloyl-ACP methyl ester carboxylesterase
MTTQVASETSTPAQDRTHRRGCLLFVRRGLLILLVGLVGLALLGLAYQAVAIETDRSGYPPRGQLYTVDGHQMHLACMGEGGPAVILQAGGVAESLWWYRIQNQLAAQTQVCAFDRPGLGWSEPVDGPRDALMINAELHALLDQAGIAPPYVMAGHSFGAVLTRIYAAQYSAEIAGIVLVDSQIMLPHDFASQADFDAWKAQWDFTQGVVSVLTRVGVARLTGAAPFISAGYPSEIAAEIVALNARNQSLDTDWAEKVLGYRSMTEESAAAEDLGDLPMAVLWAGGWGATDTALPEAPAVRAALSTYSTNSLTLTLEGSDHLSILANEGYASQVSETILAVMAAAGNGAPPDPIRKDGNDH